MSLDAVRIKGGIKDKNVPLSDCFRGYMLPSEDLLAFIRMILDEEEPFTEAEGARICELYAAAVEAGRPAVTPLSGLKPTLRAAVIQAVRTDNARKALRVVDQVETLVQDTISRGIATGEDVLEAAGRQTQYLADVPSAIAKIVQAGEATKAAVIRSYEDQIAALEKANREQERAAQDSQQAAAAEIISLGAVVQELQVHFAQLVETNKELRASQRLLELSEAFERISQLTTNTPPRHFTERRTAGPPQPEHDQLVMTTVRATAPGRHRVTTSRRTPVISRASDTAVDPGRFRRFMNTLLRRSR